jgi:hypothetical protein
VRARVSLAFLLPILLAACGSATPVPTPSTATSSVAPSLAVAPSTTATPSASVEPTQDEIRAAAARAYRKAVIPYNRTTTRLFKAYGKATTLKAWRTYCSKLDVATRTFIKAMQGITWPTDTASDAKALIRADAAADANLRSCAKARTAANWQRAWNLYVKATDRAHEAANLVRLDLGLQPVPD